EGRQVPDADGPHEHRGDHRGLRRHRRRPRQLPHAVPAQRRVGAVPDPGRQRVDPRLRRAAQRVRAVRRPVLPLPVPGAAAGRAGAVVRCQRRPRRPAGHDGPASGDRGRQARDRHGRAPHRPPAAVRGARCHVHRAQGPPRPRLPDLLARARRDHRRGARSLPGLRGLLRGRGL
ncbi:MAG: Sulfur carrier protein adenylyltransferase ThiF, partial [uncultured Solirubrobacteraceae bacterium]